MNEAKCYVCYGPYNAKVFRNRIDKDPVDSHNVVDRGL